MKFLLGFIIFSALSSVHAQIMNKCIQPLDITNLQGLPSTSLMLKADQALTYEEVFSEECSSAPQALSCKKNIVFICTNGALKQICSENMTGTGIPKTEVYDMTIRNVLFSAEGKAVELTCI